MTWPMMGSGLSFVDAFFEGVSGVTTTGLSTTASVENKSTSFLFARAWMQWYGGLGVVVLALAIIVQPGLLAKRLAIGEVDAGDPVGGTQPHFRRILLVYVLLTVAGFGALCLFGARPLYAALYAFAAVSTGGYAPHDRSLAALPGAGTVVVTLLCMAASLPLMYYYRTNRKRAHEFLADRQLWALFLLIVLQSCALGWAMSQASGMSWLEAAWHGPIMAASAQTSAGFSTTPVASLNPNSKALLIVSMFIGGGVGSTAGGVKLLRLLIVFSSVRTMLLRTTMPARAVLHPRLGHSRLDDGEVGEALTILALAICVIVVSWLALLAFGYDPLDSLFEVTSATGTVGLSAGLCGPDLHSMLKLVLCVDMLLGRLEFVAWLVLIYPRTWLGRHKPEATLEAGGEIRGHRRKEQSMRFVFVGAGNLTVRTAPLLIERGHEVVIIDPDRQRLNEVSETLDCSFLHGDGSEPQVLEESGASQNRVLFALSDDDQDNIVAALVARSQGISRVVPRITDPQFEYICEELGLEDYIVPDRTIAHYLADMAQGIDVLNLAAAIKGDARLFAWTLEEENAGNVKDLDLPKRASVICFYRQGKFHLADAETHLKNGDEIVVITHHDNLETLQKRWRPQSA